MRISHAAVAAALVLVALTGPAQAVPPPYPSGTFELQATSLYLRGVGPTPILTVTARATVTGLSEGAFVDSIDSGDRGPGSSPSTYEAWSPYVEEPGDVLGIRYDRPGTFTPRVFVTDAADETTLVKLPPVTILQDSHAPATTITLPAARGSAAAWRVLRGTATDVETGVYDIRLRVMQRRSGIWWVWGSLQQRWFKGRSSEAWTRAHVRPGQDDAALAGSAWTSAPVKGITKGLLAVSAVVRDRGGMTADLGLARQYLSRR